MARKPSSLGFTLLETMIYILLVGVVLTFAILFFAQFMTTQAKDAALREATHNARFALARVSSEVREAQGINYGSSTFGTHPGVLSLASSAPLNDPTVFAVSGGALTIQKGAGSALPLTSSSVEVTNFTLVDVSTPGRTRAVRAAITVSFKNPGGLETFNAVVSMVTTVQVLRSDGFSVLFDAAAQRSGRTAGIRPGGTADVRHGRALRLCGRLAG